MIREIATLTIDPETATDFEAAVQQARSLFLAAEGCHDMHLERVVEVTGRYLLIVQWDTIEAHMEVFRRSEAFQKWRDLAGPFFVEQPQVVHIARVL